MSRAELNAGKDLRHRRAQAHGEARYSKYSQVFSVFSVPSVLNHSPVPLNYFVVDMFYYGMLFRHIEIGVQAGVFAKKRKFDYVLNYEFTQQHPTPPREVKTIRFSPPFYFGSQVHLFLEFMS